MFFGISSTELARIGRQREGRFQRTVYKGKDPELKQRLTLTDKKNLFDF